MEHRRWLKQVSWQRKKTRRRDRRVSRALDFITTELYTLKAKEELRTEMEAHIPQEPLYKYDKGGGAALVSDLATLQGDHKEVQQKNEIPLDSVEQHEAVKTAA